MTSRNLEPGQYQLGNFIFGYNTLFSVENFDIGGYDVNVQDYQAQLADETRFGSDSLKGLPIQITIHAQKNKLLPSVVALTGDTRELDFSNDPSVGAFVREWRADEVRKQWGELKPLYVSRRSDGRTVMVFGRPGKLAVSREMSKGGYRNIVGEFRRSDSLAYNDFEWFAQVRQGETITVLRSEALGHGDGDGWLRFLLVGPMTNPIIELGDLTIRLVHELELGEIVEISSYPWARRAIRVNDNVSLNAYVTEPYLEDISLPINKAVQVSWTATSINTSSHIIDFSALSSGALSSGSWWVDADSDGGAGSPTVSGGLLQWGDSGNSDHFVKFIYKTPSITSYQYVKMQVKHPAEGSLLGSAESSNRIIGRCNATRTEYMYWDVTPTKCWYGYHRNGTDRRLSPVYDIGRVMMTLQTFFEDLFDPIFGVGNPSDDWTYTGEFGNGSGIDGSTLRINDTVLAQWEASKKTQPFSFADADHKFSGGGMKATARYLGQSTPGPLAKLEIRDNAPADVMAGLEISGVFMLWRDSWLEV